MKYTLKETVNNVSREHAFEATNVFDIIDMCSKILPEFTPKKCDTADLIKQFVNAGTTTYRQH